MDKLPGSRGINMGVINPEPLLRIIPKAGVASFEKDSLRAPQTVSQNKTLVYHLDVVSHFHHFGFSDKTLKGESVHFRSSFNEMGRRIDVSARMQAEVYERNVGLVPVSQRLPRFDFNSRITRVDGRGC